SSRTCSWIRSTRWVRAMKLQRGVGNWEWGITPHSPLPTPHSLRRLRDALHLEHFDHVANLDVVETLQAQAALEAGLDLGHVVLEALERGELAFPHHDVVAEQAGLRVALAGDAAVGDHAAGNGADLR